MYHHYSTTIHCRWTVLFLVMFVVVAGGILGLQQHHGRIGIQQSTATTCRSTSVIMDIDIVISSSTIDIIMVPGTSISISSIGGSIPVQQQGPSSLSPIS